MDTQDKLSEKRCKSRLTSKLLARLFLEKGDYSI